MKKKNNNKQGYTNAPQKKQGRYLWIDLRVYD